jgi:hypothetical protein
VEVLVITFRTNTTYRPYDDDDDGGGDDSNPVLTAYQPKGQC